MKDRIQRAGAEPVAVTAELLDDAESENRLPRRVMKNVKPDEPGVEGSILHDGIGSRYRVSITGRSAVQADMPRRAVLCAPGSDDEHVERGRGEEARRGLTIPRGAWISLPGSWPARTGTLDVDEVLVVRDHGCSGARLPGIDISDAAQRAAARRCRALIAGGRLDLRVGDGSALPWDAGAFDEVFSVNTLYFWSEPVRDLREIRRVLRRHGRLVLGFRDRSDAAVAAFPSPTHRFHSAAEVSGLLARAGFEAVDVHQRLPARDSGSRSPVRAQKSRTKGIDQTREKMMGWPRGMRPQRTRLPDRSDDRERAATGHHPAA
jgi:SAM-dependent methyltransferase